MEILALSLATIWAQWLWPILLLAVGLGLVIFVHELGHFVMAKLVGIKVERFALGFGPRLLGFRLGETDYCIKVLPLGGYVKMLGQEDFKPMEDQAQVDPRAFNAKPVWARFLVVSTGVVMNVIFAAVLFILVCIAGIQFLAPRVGGVEPGFPAAETEIRWENPPPGHPASDVGLKAGDLILDINGREISNFSRLQVAAALADAGETFRMTVERNLDGRKLIGKTTVGVKAVETDRGERFIFGIAPAASLTFGAAEEYIIDGPIRPGDELLKVDGSPVWNSWELGELTDELLSAERGNLPATVTLTVRRGTQEIVTEAPVTLRLRGAIFEKGGWRAWQSVELDEKTGTVTVTFPDGSMQTHARSDVVLSTDVMFGILGMSPRLEVGGVAEGSPAEKAGLKPGDVIVSYADRQDLTHARLREISEQFKGRQTSIIIERDGRREQKWISPVTRNKKALIGMIQDLEMERPIVGGVLAESPASEAGILAGDTIVRIVGRPAGGGDKVVAVANWIDVFNALCEFRSRPVTIEFASGHEMGLDNLDEAVFDPQVYVAGFETPPLKPLMGPTIRKDPLRAIPWGAGQTYDFIVMTYATLKSWLKGTISHKEFAGPVGISRLAIRVGRKSVVELVYFMAMISVSVAVVNFLPLPVFDGGLAVFLLIEKLRGRPVPVKVMNVVQMIGLALIAFAFIALTWNDIVQWWSSLW